MITLIQGCIFLIYVIYIISKFGMLPSISDSYYRFKGFNEVIFFWIFCTSLGFLMLGQEHHGFLFYASGIGLMLTGLMAPFKNTHFNIALWHSIGAYTCIFSALIGLLVERHTYLPLFSFFVIAIIIKLMNLKNNTFWLEISAFACIILGFWIYPS